MRFESTSSRVAASGASRSISASNVRLESSIKAHSSPSIRTPWSLKRSGSTSRGSLPSSSSPSESASRFAGSIVTTATFRPRSAIPIASAAAVVVLPTPPDPAQTTIRLPSSSGSTDVITRTVRVRAPRQGTNARSDEPFAHREGDSLRAAAGVELRDDVMEDVLHGPLGVAELLGDLARRVAGGDQREHLLLAVGQAGGGRPGGADAFRGDAAQQRREQLRRHHAGVVRDGLDRSSQALRGQRVLAQVADGSGRHG